MDKKIIKGIINHTDLWPWYWLSYGEKCYAFATVQAFPLREEDEYPEPGSELIQCDDSDGSDGWMGKNGTPMLIESWIATINCY